MKSYLFHSAFATDIDNFITHKKALGYTYTTQIMIMKEFDTFCFNMHPESCDIRYIQDIWGHKSLKNTEIYTKVDREDLKKTLNKYHPRVFRRIVDESEHKQIKKAI